MRNGRRVFNLAMVEKRQPLEHRPPGRRHLDSVRHRADLSAVAFRPGLRGLRRLVHHPLDTLGMAGRSRGTGSIRCHRGHGVPGWRNGDDVLAEVREGKRLAWRFPMLAQRAVEDSPRWTRARKEPARPPSDGATNQLHLRS
ncbi:MAG: hypothetical protein LZF62_310051 [Nitrospira sp.]|nr:MAG: hypothetical protein LZF62_310051 [Nitrospira sp.]